MAFPSQSLQQVQKQSQQLVLAPQLRQSLKNLQVPALDLRAAIQEELQSNPLLEELPMDTPSLEAESDGAGSDAISNNENDHDGERDGSNDNDNDSDGDREGPSTDTIERDLEILHQLDDDWRDYYSSNGSN